MTDNGSLLQILGFKESYVELKKLRNKLEAVMLHSFVQEDSFNTREKVLLSAFTLRRLEVVGLE